MNWNFNDYHKTIPKKPGYHVIWTRQTGHIPAYWNGNRFEFVNKSRDPIPETIARWWR